MLAWKWLAWHSFNDNSNFESAFFNLKKIDVARLTAPSLHAKLTAADCTLIRETRKQSVLLSSAIQEIKETFPKVEIVPFLSCRSAVSTGIFLYGKSWCWIQGYTEQLTIWWPCAHNSHAEPKYKGLFVCMCMETNEKRPTLKNLI